MTSDSVAESYAKALVFLAKDPELRFAELVIQPQRDPARLYPQVLGREIGDRITIKIQPPGGGSTIVRDVWVRGIRHEVTKTTWKTTWYLQSATKFPFLLLNHATLGKLDENALAF